MLSLSLPRRKQVGTPWLTQGLQWVNKAADLEN